MSKLEALKGLIEALEKVKEETNSGDSMPSIAEASIKMEHQKYKLANHLNKTEHQKQIYLAAINVGLVTNINIMSALLQLIEKDASKDNILQEMEESFDSLLESLEALFKKIETELKDE